MERDVGEGARNIAGGSECGGWSASAPTRSRRDWSGRRTLERPATMSLGERTLVRLGRASTSRRSRANGSPDGALPTWVVSSPTIFFLIPRAVASSTSHVSRIIKSFRLNRQRTRKDVKGLKKNCTYTVNVKSVGKGDEGTSLEERKIVIEFVTNDCQNRQGKRGERERSFESSRCRRRKARIKKVSETVAWKSFEIERCNCT